MPTILNAIAHTVSTMQISTTIFTISTKLNIDTISIILTIKTIFMQLNICAIPSTVKINRYIIFIESTMTIKPNIQNIITKNAIFATYIYAYYTNYA